MSQASKSPPRIIAMAIADMAADQVREAHALLEAWAALTKAGVPVHDLRHALDVERVNTEASGAVGTWAGDGERGLLVIRGPVDCGKTFAAVRWAIDRNRRGMSTRWYQASQWPNAFDEMDRLARELERVDALVIDDLGDGSASPEMRKKLQGVLGVRIAADKPTVIVSNSTEAELRSWLGDRLVSRQKIGGGFIDIATTLGMRKRESVPFDKAGRSPRWYTAKRTVDIFGAEWRERFVDDGAPELRWLEVGHVLEQVCRDPRRAVDGLAQVSRAWWIVLEGKRVDMAPLFTASDAAIERHVVGMRERDRKAIAAAGRAVGLELDAQLLTWEAALADATRVMASERFESKRDRAEPAKPVGSRSRCPDPARDIRLPRNGAPEKQDCIRIAYRHGLRVREVGASSIDIVDGEHVITRGCTWAVYNGDDRMAEGFNNDTDAWHWAWLQTNGSQAEAVTS
jgi:hypothetical protein